MVSNSSRQQLTRLVFCLVLCPFLHLITVLTADQLHWDPKNRELTLKLTPIEHNDFFRVRISSNISLGFPRASEVRSNSFTISATNRTEFFRLEPAQVSSNLLLGAHLLNRIAYGPTPNELRRVLEIGPNAFIEEQLSPELIEDLPEFTKPILRAGWQYVTVTAPASSSRLHFLLDEYGVGWIDDVHLVKGTVPEQGSNLITNGSFEAVLEPHWQLGPSYRRSHPTGERAKHGSRSLVVLSDGAGTYLDSVFQNLSSPLRIGDLYTLSYWYYRDLQRPVYFQSFLEGAGPVIGGVFVIPERQLDLATRVGNGLALPADLRAWHTLKALKSKRQLLQVLLQFIDNLFVTQMTKSEHSFFGWIFLGPYTIKNGVTLLEELELRRWEDALLNPACTFYDLLRISIESPAMVIYLDTLLNGYKGGIANENFSRELLELFTFGVDNGYSQEDVTAMSPAWTGWYVRPVDPRSSYSPLSPVSTETYPGAHIINIRSLAGRWNAEFQHAWHYQHQKVVFAGKRVPGRFGAPYAGRAYELTLPPRGGTNGLQDSYDIIAHIANQPFTQEHISVKLCRLLVHDDFHPGYDFTSPSLSAEGKLVLACMRAWESGNPKGQLRHVLRTILYSDLFRSGKAISQKIKNPFEFTVSAIRALRTENPDGSWTADSDGYALHVPMDDMSNMILFDRGEPDGYPEQADPWISVGSLSFRIQFIQSLLHADPGAPAFADPGPIIRNMLPAPSWKDASAVAGLFLGLLFPTEGAANLAEYETAAVEFLHTAAEESGGIPFQDLIEFGAEYQARVRGMVALLMSLPRFNEQ